MAEIRKLQSQVTDLIQKQAELALEESGKVSLGRQGGERRRRWGECRASAGRVQGECRACTCM